MSTAIGFDSWITYRHREWGTCTERFIPTCAERSRSSGVEVQGTSNKPILSFLSTSAGYANKNQIGVLYTCRYIFKLCDSNSTISTKNLRRK